MIERIRDREGGREVTVKKRETIDTKKYKKEIVYYNINTDTNSSDNNHASYK